MLRSRSRAAVSSKQALGSDRSIISTPAQDNTTIPRSFFLGSPRFFGRYFTKVKKGGEFDALMSPASTLDMKPIFPSDRPVGYGENIIQHSPRASGVKRPWDTSNSNAIGLALITFPDETPAGAQYKQATRRVTFTSHLKVQIPPADSPYSDSDFGTKTRNQQLISPRYFFQTRDSPVTTGRLTVAEMELSEDYTRVTSHGPIQTTTHIYDNCVVKSCGFPVGSAFTSAKTKIDFSTVGKNSISDNFLSSCHTCKKSLNHKQDIYIYRGEKAFCSQACRAEEMLKDRADYDD